MRRRGRAAVQSSFLLRCCVSCLVVMLDILSVSIGMNVLLHDVLLLQNYRYLTLFPGFGRRSVMRSKKALGHLL